MYTRPLPTITAANRAYWEGCREGELRLPTCGSCGHVWFPPSSWCPRCLSGDVGWTVASGRGRLSSWNVFHRGYFAAFRDDVPYLTALIELEEGPLMTSSLVDADPADLVCDLHVRVVFDAVTPDVTIPRFRIDQDEPSALEGAGHAL